jgi:Ca2+-binding EF-hand superfamily protein
VKYFIYLFLGNTGKISTAQFRHLAFGDMPLQGFRPETIDAYIAELSGNTQWITFEQYKQFMQAETQNFANPLVMIELKQAFSEVDSNKDGFISPQEARQGITLAGRRIPGASFDYIAQTFDDNGDGKLSLEEFLRNIKNIYQ